MSSYDMVKAGCAIPIAAALDRQVLGIDSFERNIMFGCITAGGLYAGSFVTNLIPVDITAGNSYISGKTVVQRVIEISTGSIVGYGVNKALGNDQSPADMAKRLGCLVLTDVASSYMADYIAGSPLSYLTGNV